MRQGLWHPVTATVEAGVSQDDVGVLTPSQLGGPLRAAMMLAGRLMHSLPLVLLMTGAVAAGERTGINLASDTAWTLRCDDGPARPIKVPGGGWNSDQQTPPIPSAAVKDHAVYERRIAIPAEAQGRTVRVRFGGCNYGAEVWLDDTKVVDHAGPMTPFEADLTGVAEPGKTHRLLVKAYTRMHYGEPPSVPVPFDFNHGIPGVPSQYNGHTKFAYGLTGYVRLVVLPAVHVSDVFVQPSAAKKQLDCDIWVANSSQAARHVQLTAAFSSWNGKPWNYPSVPSRDLEVPAGKTVKVSLSDIPWTPGPESYWWPNIPFCEDYVATLHWLDLSLREGGKTIDGIRQRFGFVEHGEGDYYYTVNGVRYTSFSDSNSYGQIGEYDCWTETPCFQPPHDSVKGCPETWKRYQRLGFNSMRLSTSVPTETMLETADEAGYMLIPEGGSWGNGTARFHRENFGRQLQDTIRLCRNHPSVARYSLCNEPREQRDANWPWRGIIDDARAADPSRPLVMETHAQGSGRVDGLQSGGHAFIMEHYGNIEKVGKGQGIRGMGEFDWGTDNMGNYALNVRKLRLCDWAHFAPWSMVNFWPNLLEGMNHARHPWKFNNHADRTDGVDGWDSPLVKFLQRSQHPYLIQDLGVLAENSGPPRGHENGGAEWPYQMPIVSRGQSVEREVEVFNGGLSGHRLTLVWCARWDKPDGEIAVKGGEIPCEIEPGFHLTKKPSFTVPAPGHDLRPLYVLTESRKDGQTVFVGDGVCLKVLEQAPAAAAAAFLGTDDKTRGAWQGKYGADGYELAAKESKLPGSVRFRWEGGELWTYDKATDDPRALAYFANPPTGKDRIAAGRYGNELAFELDVGSTPRRLSLYHLDYDRKSRRQSVEITAAQTRVSLDKREIADFAEGLYQSWQVQGKIRVTIRHMAGDNAIIAGIFLDPMDPREYPKP